MTLTLLFEFFLTVVAGALLTAAILIGIIVWWKIDDYLTDKDIEKAYPELKGKLK